MKNKSFKKSVLMTLLFYNILFLIITVVFVKAIPKLLVYPPNSINTEFERHIDDGFYYDEQGGAIILIAMLLSNVTFLLELRRIKDWNTFVDKEIKSEDEKRKLDKIKKQCYSIPIKLYLYHAFVPTIATSVGLALTRCKNNFGNKAFGCGTDDIYNNWIINICFLKKLVSRCFKNFKK